MMKSHSSFSASSGHLVTRYENAAFNRNRTADAPGARGMPRPAPPRRRGRLLGSLELRLLRQESRRFGGGKAACRGGSEERWGLGSLGEV